MKSTTRKSTPLSFAAAISVVIVSSPVATAVPNSRERAALTEWSSSISAAIVYTHDREIHKVTLENPNPVDLGDGEYARWSPDGKRLAVYHRGRVYVMDADGTQRTELVSDADRNDQSPIEFHTNGEEIIFWKEREGFYSVNIENREVRKLNAPGVYSGEPGISADGTRMAARWDNDLYVIDLVNGTHRKYARGCSSGVSPSGRMIMNNVGNHRQMEIRNWDGSGRFRISAESLDPDRRWDNHHWSNHEDYIAAQGDRNEENIYLFNVRDNEGIRVTWEEGYSPDAHVVAKDGTVADYSTVSARIMAALLDQNVPEGPMFQSDAKWPGSHSGLVFLWENAEADNEILDAEEKLIAMSRVKAAGAGRFGRFYDMDVTGGAFLAEDDSNERLLEAAWESGELTLELVVTPGDRDVARGHELGRLISFSQGTHERNFTLNLSGDELQIHMRTSQGRRRESSMTDFPDLPRGETTHLIVTYRDGEVVCYMNGRVVDTDGDIEGDFRDWEPGILSFGNEADGDRDWAGSIEGIAIYSRFLEQDEAVAHYRMYAPKLERTSEPRFTVRAELLETSRIPDPNDIHPYRRALVINTFRVDPTDGLKTDNGKIQVAQWAVLDGNVTPDMRALEIGDAYPLLIESFESHPQLESELQVTDSDDFDVPLYYDVRPSITATGNLARRD